MDSEEVSLLPADRVPGVPLPRAPRPPRYWRNWAAFFLLGTINNLIYVVINSAADNISHNFHADNLIGLIPWANNAFGFALRALNAFWMQNTPYALRVVGIAVVMATSLIGLAFSANFFISLVFIVISGSACSFGESALLGYLRLYPSTMVNGWSSGTGAAGILGSALYLLYRSAGLSLRDSFLLTVPYVGLYVLAYWIVLDRIEANQMLAKNSADRQRLLEQVEQDRRAAFESAQDSSSVNDDNYPLLQSSGVSRPVETRLERYKRLGRLIWYPSLMLALVYFFEYVISSGAASKALSKAQSCRLDKGPCLATEHCEWSAKDNVCNSTIFIYKNLFSILAFCYQFGVFLSRSSLQLFKIRHIGLLTLLQGINFVLWILQDQYKFMDAWALLPLMVYVGLLGGASYVNVFYILLNDPKIPNIDREMCINLCAIGITAGITLACAFVVLIDVTFLKNL